MHSGATLFEGHTVTVLALFAVFAQEMLIARLEDRSVNKSGAFTHSINTPCVSFGLIQISFLGVNIMRYSEPRLFF